jgi:hypothetical protein
METSVKHNVANEVQNLRETEMLAISGGAGIFVDTTGMPDRSVACGTMWYQDLLKRILGLPR